MLLVQEWLSMMNGQGQRMAVTACLLRLCGADDSPHRISRRLPFYKLREPARLLRLPHKGGVITPALPSGRDVAV